MSLLVRGRIRSETRNPLSRFFIWIYRPVIRAVLRAPVDLLWNGGIGTYVKSVEETDAEVQDRSNDGVRVDARDLRCKVVGEGGNLGLTQLGRIEFALNDGRIIIDPAPDQRVISGVSVDLRLGHRFRVFSSHTIAYIDLSGSREQVNQAVEKVMGERRNVFAPVAQRRGVSGYVPAARPVPVPVYEKESNRVR